MARGGWSTSNYLKNTVSAPFTAVPFTLAGWVNVPSSGTAVLCSVTDKDSSDNRNALYISGSNLTVLVGNSTPPGFTEAMTFGAWCFAAWVESSGSNRKIWVNGSSSTNSSPFSFGAGADSITFGVLGDATPSSALSGDMAEWGAWDRALSDDEIAALAAGYAPSFFRRNLVGYYPLNDGDGDERDFGSGGRTLTETGTVTKAADHPRIIYPRSRSRVFVSSGAAPPSSVSPHASSIRKYAHILGR